MLHDWFTKKEKNCNLFLNRYIKNFFKKIKFRHARLIQKVHGILTLEMINASLAWRIASLFEVKSSRGTSSVLSIEWAGGV